VLGVGRDLGVLLPLLALLQEARGYHQCVVRVLCADPAYVVTPRQKRKRKRRGEATAVVQLPCQLGSLDCWQ
jgi:hypothetical protein